VAVTADERASAEAQSRPSRSRFSPQVQALRAVAVTGVVVYHLWPDSLRGGFAGVDVFFVISGYLITRHLVEELARNGRVSLTDFWARRIRRILPAAFTVLLVCLVLTVVVLPSVGRVENLEEIRASTLFVENWLLGSHAVNYLAAENAPSVVQHYWSLSVEEQFYLLWPFVILLALPLTAATGLRRPRFALLFLLTTVIASSLFVSIRWTSSNAPRAFFATPTRAWEFAVGGLVAVLTTAAPTVTAATRSLSAKRRRTATGIVGWVGLGLVAVSFLLVSSADPWPGSWALLPVTGAALLLASSARPQSGSLTTVSSARSIQWLGDHSYSVYLWHWPLIIVAPVLAVNPHAIVPGLAIVAICLVLAALTKRLVEDPVRIGRWPRSHIGANYAFAGVAALVLVLLSSQVSANVQHSQTTALAHDRQQAAAQAQHALTSPQAKSCFGAAVMVGGSGCSGPFARPKGLDLAFAAADGSSDSCLESSDTATPLFCTLGTTGKPVKTIAIVGNSHAWRLLPAVNLYAKQHHWRVITALRINCMGLITTRLAPASPSANCLRWSSTVQKRLLAWPGLSGVIFPSYDYEQKFLVGDGAPAAQVQAAQAAVLNTWKTFDAHGIRVVVTEDVPGMRSLGNDPQCIAESRQKTDPCAIARSAVVQPNLASTLALAHPAQAGYVPLSQFFCDPTTCHAIIGGVVVYFDSHHMTTTFSESLAPYLGPEIATALKQPPT
jgi:peptidoglycan/LPS O-acetylase OafA/YrhL